MGIALNHFEQFLRDTSRDVDWDILCLQEFSGRRKGTPSSMWYTDEGHRVFQQAPLLGRKISALIVHARNVAFVVSDSFCSIGRCCFLDVVLSGHKLRIINAHLDPGHIDSKGLYSKDCDNIDDIIRTTPLHFKSVLCADAQDQLGPLDQETIGILGNHAMGPRGDKGDMFLTACCLNKLVVWNTMFDDPGSHYTCHHFQKSEPNQIDALLAT